MSRKPRAGTAAGKITIRATVAELAAWDAAARHAGADRSTWLRQAALELAAAGGERKRGWMRHVARVEVTAETLTREMAADLMAVADVRVATDCQAFLDGRGGKAKLSLIREQVAGAYNRLSIARGGKGR